MIIDQVTQQAQEKKIYTLDYSDWLVTDEELTDVVAIIDPVGTSPDLVVGAAIAVTNTAIELTVSGGEVLKDYSVFVNVTTDKGQIKTDCLLFSIYGTCSVGTA